MANSLDGNPWVIDTAGAAVLYATDVLVEHFEFVGYAAQGNKCVVKDRFGKIVWTGVGDADLEDICTTKIGWIYGLAVTQLDGGGVFRCFFK